MLIRNILIIGLVVGIVSGSDPVRLVWVDGDDKLVIDDEAIHELVGRGNQVSEVTVIGGYGMGAGLSTVFNTFTIDDRASATLQGFPMRTALTSKRHPSVWIQRTGKLSESGSEIILLSCESCSVRSQRAGSVSVSSRLFHFVQHLSHHLIYHTSIPGHSRMEHLELLLHQSEVTEFSKVISETSEAASDASKSDVIHLSTPVPDVKTPITWVWSGDEHTYTHFTNALEDLKSEGANFDELSGYPLSQMIPDAKMLLLDDMTLCQNSDLEEGFKNDLEKLFADVASNTRPWRATVSTIWNYAKALIKTINNNEQPARLPKADQIVQASIADRKMYALALYRDMLSKVSEGDPEWLRVLDIADSSEPRKLLEATSSGRNDPFLQIILTLSSSKSYLSEAAPCTFSEVKSSEARAWDFSIKFFTSGFKGIKEAQSETNSLRKELTKIRNTHREKHSEKVSNYISQLDEILSDSITSYYAKGGYEEICPAAFEKKAHDELQIGLSSIYSMAKEWWPGYDDIPMAEEKARSEITNRFEERVAIGNQLLEARLSAGTDAAIADYKIRCSHVSDTATKTSALRSACYAARSTADSFIASLASSIPEGECKGNWVLDTTLFVKASKKLTAALLEVESDVIEKNDNILKKVAGETRGAILVRAELELSQISEVECPDEEQLDSVASIYMLELETKLTESWNSYDAKICSEIIAEGIASLKEVIADTREKIENRLFGSEEAREWRQEWLTVLDERIANCTLCPYSSYHLWVCCDSRFW